MQPLRIYRVVCKRVFHIFFVRQQPLKVYPPNLMEKFQITWAVYFYNRFLKEKMSK
ncbi:hypothetical protein Leryth_016185 [Lithospermum erythrorhizon]|nr:hypothetical protein Leryth_016185 [Lithospermum erythrorhizon]